MLGSKDSDGIVGTGIALLFVVADCVARRTALQKPTFSHLAAFVAGIAFAPLVSLLSVRTLNLLLEINPERVPSPQTASAATAITVVALSPAIEEYVFRGRVLTSASRRAGPLVGVLFSSALFACFHLNAWLAIGAFVSGVLLGYLTIATRGISHSLCLHSGLNACGLAGGFVTSASLSQVLVLTSSFGVALAFAVRLSRQRHMAHA